ncbi:AAA domain-containing protein [Gracilibacillus thailandensis]|uniref:DUF2726 domain-containing protein n=1 Tax=Gracilibacillus thailandensis TaxID=563735 RepID=A0A6N7QY68_9BACI|nr:AAA domain-containing protein [Gracilibacillus thailandensis]MRI65825.1 DUF2726 domain-containing protein [Gracilibacillus thailandensis]
MDTEKYLVLVKGEDKTDQLEFCRQNHSQWEVKYKNNQKVYMYKQQNVQFLSEPRVLELQNHLIYHQDRLLSNISHMLDFGEKVKLVFQNGFKKMYVRNELHIEESETTNSNSKKVLNYLRELAQKMTTKDEEESFLKKQFNKLVLVSPQSVLATYLGKKDIKQRKLADQLIFPFGFNESQKQATEKAFNNQLSIIEGPPGTGKTQTILNIIANAIFNNKTVAVVSNNNSATSNIREKLQKYELEFISAYLGNKENKETFFNNQTGNYPNMETWPLEEETIKSLKSRLKEQQKSLGVMLHFQNEKAKLQQQLSDFEVEKRYFNEYYEATNISFNFRRLSRLKADKILKMLVEYESQLEKGKLSLSYKLFNVIKYRFFNFSFYKAPSEEITAYLQKLYYELKISELKNLIEELTDQIQDYDFKNAMQEYSEVSMDLFKASLQKRYNNVKKRTIFNPNILWTDFNEFMKEYPVILSTTHSLRNCSSNHLFDYVLIDEASQVDIVTGSLALSSAKNAVIVGDLKQLPNVVTDDIKEQTDKIYATYQLPNAYKYAEYSLLASIDGLFKNVPKTLLREHYRCHPKIINFCNQKFYNNELIILTEEEPHTNPLLLYKTVKGNHARGTVNQRQIDVIKEEIIPEVTKGNEGSLGIISPFRKQVDSIHTTINDEEMEVDTVHKYQGREKSIIILSTVLNNMRSNDFADDDNLINVAISRAVDQLVVVTADSGENWHRTNIGDLIKYIKYNNFEIRESKIYSVFDLLYKNYANELAEMEKGIRSVSANKSENLINHLLEQLLRGDSFQSLDFIMHQPLRMLIKDTELLSHDEYTFAMNILTHTDFLIFNKMDKSPVLVIEVDGHAFHEENKKQLKRDEMKDQILQKYEIPVLRLKTTGSREKQVIQEKLKDILN